MYGSTLQNSGIPWIRSYQEALAHYEDVTPIRGTGSNAGTRPLGARNKPHFQIVKHANLAISCRLYKTDVITFFYDNEILFNTDRYNTGTTANFISQVLGRPCGKYDNRLVLHVDGGEYTVNQSLRLKNVDGRYEVTKCQQDIVHTINRKAMNEIRKPYQEYIAYLSGMAKMCEGKMAVAELKTRIVNIHSAIGNIPDIIGMPPKIELSAWGNDSNTSDYMDRFLSLVHNNQEENWYLSFLWLVHSARQHWGGGYLQFDVKFLLDAFDDILIAKNTRVLVPKLVPAGKVQADRYKRFRTFLRGA